MHNTEEAPEPQLSLTVVCPECDEDARGLISLYAQDPRCGGPAVFRLVEAECGCGWTLARLAGVAA